RRAWMANSPEQLGFMHPSLITTFISLVPASLLTAGLLAWVWRTTDRSRFMASWALASGFAALAFLLFGLRGTLPELLVILVANVALHLFQMLLWAGARWLRGAHVPLWVLPLPSLSWLLACTVPGFVEAPGVRLMLASVLLIGEALAFAIEMWRGGWTGRVGAFARMMIGLALLHVILQTTQLVAVILTGPVTWLTFLVILLAGPVVVAIGLLGLALAIARSAERDATQLAEGRLRELELQSRAAERETAALRAGRAEVERLHNGLPALIFVREVKADGSSRLLYRGGDIEAMTGWTAESLKDIDNISIFAEDPSAFTKAMVAATRQSSGSVDWRMRRPASGWNWMRSIWTMQEQRPDGTGILIGYCINVTAEREANARAAAAGRLASLGEMAAGLAHELKQPLQAILLSAELTQAAAPQMEPAEVQDRLELVITEAIRAGQVIDNLRRFALGDPDGTPVTITMLPKVIANVMVLLHASLVEAEIELVTQGVEEAPPVLGHPVALEQVLANIVLNARDAIAAGPAGAPRRVTMAAQEADGRVRFSVADTGEGILPDVLARMFEPFVTTKGPDRGTGLGLSISRGLMQAMGGTIEAHNGPEGAVLTLTLPRAGQDPAVPLHSPPSAP
ncbi:MAG: ATP-binding protein, partial [Roseococcus sp.]